MTITDEPVTEPVTDEYGPATPLVAGWDEGAGPPVPHTDGREPCPGCGNLYFKGTGMARHVDSAHPELYDSLYARKSKKKFPCDECPTVLGSKDSLAKHKRRHAKKAAIQTRIDAATAPVPVHRSSTASLSAEEITRAAAIALWPRGIPHDKFSALLNWHKQTETFLAEVT